MIQYQAIRAAGQYIAAYLRFEVQLWWLILTGRGEAEEPQSLADAYNRMVRLWYRKERVKHGKDEN